MIQVARRPLSLETPTDDEEDSVLGDFIQDREAPAPDESATYNLLKEHLEEVLNTLPPREVRILQLRYGLLDGQAYTLEEVGRKMGVTRERVRQTLKRTLLCNVLFYVNFKQVQHQSAYGSLDIFFLSRNFSSNGLSNIVTAVNSGLNYFLQPNNGE